MLLIQGISTLTCMEDIGAPAYLGAAPLVTNTAIPSIAVEIHTVEAQRATAWRYLAGMVFLPFAFATPRTMSQVLALAQPLL